MTDAVTDVTELTAETVVDGVTPAHPVISPDGRWVAYTAATIDGPEPGRTGAIWVAAADGSSPARQLTAGTAQDRLPRWAPDSASLFFGSDRAEPGVSQLHRIRLDGGEAVALTDRRGGTADHYPLADGRTVALIAEDEPTAQDERRRREGDDAVAWDERQPRSRLLLLDLATREPRRVDALADRHVVELAQRPDGGPLAVVSWSCPDIDPGSLNSALHLVDPVSGAVRQLGPAALDASSPAWWRQRDGGWHLAYLAVTPPELTGGLAVLDLAVPGHGPAGEHRNLTEGLAVCPDALVQVADGPPLALFAEGLDTALYRLDPEAGRFRRLTVTPGLVTALTANRTGEQVAVRVSTAHEPEDVHAGPVGGPLTRISDTRPELRAIRWGTQERLGYRASDGLALDALLILPPGRSRADGPFPLVTIAHGGPDDRYADELQLNPMLSGQWLALAGFAVLLPNPRGSTGRGHAFVATVTGRVGQEEWTDITTGIDLLVAEGVADPDRLGICGWSHGGYLTAWAVGRTDRFKAAITGAGISDWGMQGVTGEFGALDAALGGSNGWEGPGPHPHDARSPISYASRITTPLLILHGQEDANVPVGQGLFLHQALRHSGVTHEFVVYPREGHWISERGHQLDLLRRTRAWFTHWLGQAN
jgi:dipeptidyl aminopeptidase/acylaminoacyl peptidase